VITPADAWERYATKAKPRRAVNAAGASTWLNWTQHPDHGPNESILGDVRDKRVIELGCGAGANLAHLATLGARCVGIDLAPGRITNATQIWGHLPNLEFLVVDAVDHLAKRPGYYDVVFSIFGAAWFTPPDVLLPLVRDTLVPGGLFAFSHLPAAGGSAPTDRVVTKYNLTADEWTTALMAHGFEQMKVKIIDSPEVAADQRGTLLAQARRAASRDR
jgi:SAM-dependent methyltransferase